MLPVVLTAVFLIVAIVSYRSLTECSIFGRVSSAVLACSVAALSVIGLMRFGLDVPAAGEKSKVVIVPILIPYAALAIALVGALLVAFFAKLLGGRSSRALRNLGHRIRRRLSIRSEGTRRDGGDLRQLRG